ncbi:hypothetical protein HO133_007372 [Letharia lupina]|uniref:Terpene synthase n=1 Tax=Letharia lupina TaxID=560253 RepID=A0A8H6FIP0_9LECA|nr:uncharacterized protein HO133_007372 [Letharia lupina]KAF6229256.1 hypothetical protein HO133_007372 [Letharia lupina]
MGSTETMIAHESHSKDQAPAREMMLRNSEASCLGGSTPQKLIHEVVVKYKASVPREEPHQANASSHEEEVPSPADKAYGENGTVRQQMVYLPDMPDEFRNVCDWLNWAFDFDDPFDGGELRDRPEEAKKLVDNLLVTLEATSLEGVVVSENILVEVFRSVWLRLARDSSKETQGRFRGSMTDSCNGLIQQTEACIDPNNFDLNGYLATRCQTIAAYPLYAMVEYCYGIAISDEVIACKSIQTIQRLSTELTVLQNDVLSYHKEKRLGFEHTLVSIYIRQGKTQTEAYDCVDQLMKDRYRDWYLALAELPMWGEDVGKQVQVYIQGCQNMVVANLNWSFKTERYFGREHWNVRRTRIVPFTE